MLVRCNIGSSATDKLTEVSETTPVGTQASNTGVYLEN
jgi:hypothetical protein